MRTPGAVLFDFDGVLADTENVHIAAWERVFGDLGWEVEPATCARAAEVDDRAFLASVFAERGVEDGDLSGWVWRKQDLTRTILRNTNRLYPGVDRLVESLRGQVRLAVVSVTWRENIEAVLESSGLLDSFDLIVGKEDVTSVKPSPEAYLNAVARLGIQPNEAVALEDSPSGLESARAAHVPVVVVGHRYPRSDWVGATPYLPNLQDLDVVLQTLRLR